jgi:hypothetical protein
LEEDSGKIKEKERALFQPSQGSIKNFFTGLGQLFP